MFSGWLLEPLQFIAFDTCSRVHLFEDVGGHVFVKTGSFDINKKLYTHDEPLEYALQEQCKALLWQAAEASGSPMPVRLAKHHRQLEREHRCLQQEEAAARSRRWQRKKTKLAMQAHSS